MEQIPFRLKYEGSSADQHMLPAHEGARSIEGMAWALSLVGHYAATGTIQKRGSLDPRIQFFIRPAQRGSFVTDIVAVITKPENIWLTTVIGTYAVATATDSINFLVRYAFKRVCGLGTEDTKQEKSKIKKLPSGDVEALVDAIEPSVSRAHGIIGGGASKMILQKARTTLVDMDDETKNYVRTNITDEFVTKMDLSVGALNVNSGNGRVFLDDVGKTVPFSVVKEPTPGTYEALSASLNSYARGVPSRIPIAYREVSSTDGRIKKLLVLGAGSNVTNSNYMI